MQDRLLAAPQRVARELLAVGNEGVLHAAGHGPVGWAVQDDRYRPR